MSRNQVLYVLYMLRTYIEYKKSKSAKVHIVEQWILICATEQLVVCRGPIGGQKFIEAGIVRIKGKLFNRLCIFSVSLS